MYISIDFSDYNDFSIGCGRNDMVPKFNKTMCDIVFTLAQVITHERGWWHRKPQSLNIPHVIYYSLKTSSNENIPMELVYDKSTNSYKAQPYRERIRMGCRINIHISSSRFINNKFNSSSDFQNLSVSYLNGHDIWINYCNYTYPPIESQMDGSSDIVFDIPNINTYHHYVFNHEFGHIFGLKHDSSNGEPTNINYNNMKEPCPIMVQQTRGIPSRYKACPFPNNREIDSLNTGHI